MHAERNYRKVGDTILLRRPRRINETIVPLPEDGSKVPGPVDKDASTFPLATKKNMRAALKTLR